MGIQNNQKIRDSAHVSRSRTANLFFEDFLIFNAFWKSLWLIYSASDFLGLLFGPGFFLEVLLGAALGIFLGFDFCQPSDHPCHLKSGVPQLGNLRCPLYRHVW